jgi:hypothetical protein
MGDSGASMSYSGASMGDSGASISDSGASMSDILISGPNFNDNDVIEFKSSFDNAVLTILSNNKNLNSKVYFRDRYENTLNKLTGKIPYTSAQEKHQIREKMGYSVDSHGNLCKTITNKETKISCAKQIVYIEIMFEKLYTLHCLKRLVSLLLISKY